MISEKLAAIYNKAEDKYFDMLDFLDSKGIPVYAYSDFFENKGIPSFVVTIAIFLILLIALALVFSYQGPDVGQLTLSLKDSDGKGLTGVSILVKDKQGIELYKGTSSDGQKITLGRALYTSDKIYIIANKDGYQQTSLEFTIGENNNSPRLRFSKEFESIEAKLRLIDKETKTPVNDATVILTSSDLSYELIEDNNNFYKKSGIPAGEELLLKVTAEGYNAYEQRISFLPGQVKEIQLDPSTQAYVGKAAVGISVKGIDEKLINDVKVTVYNKQNNTIEVSDYTRNGSLVASITAGVPLRITAEKEGYLSYDSDRMGEGITIREKEKQINITLEQGGQNLHVSVNDSQLGLSLEGALVQIFNSDLSLFDEGTTSVTGIDFSGLNPLETVYITGYVEGYLPGREKVMVSSTEDVKVLLTKVTASNSARLDIYSLDPKGNPVNGINVIVNEIVDGNVIPSGIPLVQTSFAGYATATVPVKKTYQIIGYNESFEAVTTIELVEGELDKKVYLNMQKKINVVEMKLLDVFGKDILGTATVSGLDGENLYDGNIESGTIFFNGDQRETVEVSVEMLDGNVFTENVIIKGKDYVEVIVYNKDSASLTPTVEFIGIENENGDKVEGVTPGAFYWAKFSVNYPRAASKAGIHFRAGSDNTPLAESETIGVYDLSMQGATVNYSTSFTPTPEPGNEAVDRANIGSQGEKNKWVEGTITQPKGTYTIKVKLRVEDFTPGKVQLKYRTWAVVGSEYYRAPIDDDIGTLAFADAKSGLYAATEIQEIVLYESLPECSDTICITTNFIDSEENLLNTETFEAMKGKLYAVEVEVTSKEQDYLKVSAGSDNNINFDSTQTGTLYFARETEVKGSTKKEASVSLSVAEGAKQKARFYFTAEEIGAAKIKINVAGKATIDKELNFKVVNEKTLLVELSEEQVIVGKNFTVKVTDSGLLGMNNALVKILDKEGKAVKTIIGDNTDGKGKDGYYRIQNNLSVGLYTVEVSAPTYATNTVPLLVTTRNVFSFPENLEVKLPQGQKYTTIDSMLVNNSEFVIQNIAFDVEGQIDEEETEIDYNTGEEITSGTFRVTADVPSAMSKNQKQTVPITVTFNGSDDDSADETVTITISGLVEGKFLAKVSAEIHMVYNRQLDSSCLKVEDSSAVINLVGNEGTTDSVAIEVTNNCDQDITLKKRIRAKTKLSAIQLDAEDYLDLKAGEVKDLVITAYNGAERVRDEMYGFELVYDSNYLKKTINVTVKLINPNLALSYPAQINLYLAQGSIKDKATAAQPIFVTNISAFPIENISFSQSSNYTSSGVRLEIQPTESVNLERGQSITPAKVLFATANSKITEPVESAIEIKGRFGNLNNKAAQYDRYQYYDMYNEGTYGLSTYAPKTSTLASYTNTNKVLGVIKVITMYSGYNCLKASLADSISDPFLFPSAGVQIGKMITVTNMCAEPVMLSGATPADYKPSTNTYGGVNPLASSVMLFVPQVTIMPSAVVKVPLSITTSSPAVKRDRYEIVVNGVTQLSQTLISSKPFYVKLASGINVSDDVSRSTKIKVRECVASNSKEEGKEIELVAPLTTDTANCADRYCDAQNAAKYLAQKIEQVIQKARSAGYSKKDVTEDGFPCQLEGACTFAEIGMDEDEVFDLYLQNDSISTNMMYKELNNVNSDGGNTTPFREGAYMSSGFLVEPSLVEMTFIKQRVLSGYGKTVYFDPSFSGCGYYQVSISGAFKSGVEGLDTMTPVLIVKARSMNGISKIVTRECQNEIGNITNFNPIDSGLNPGKEYGSWLTTINPETRFTEMAKKIAKDRFKSEERVTASSNGNVITITQGALTNALAQICVSGNDRKNITVTVDSSISSNFDTKQKDAFAQSITQLVTNTLAGKFGDNCVIKVGDTYSCINLSELGNLGDRKLSFLSNDLMFSSSQGGCVSGTLYSTINEQLTFSVIPNMTPIPFFGVREITVSSDDTVARPLVQLDISTLTPNTTANTSNPVANTATNNPSTTAPSTQTPASTPASETKTPPAVKTQNVSEIVDKLFFADANPPQTQKTDKSARVSSGVVYKQKFNGGGIEAETITNTPMQLIPNPSSKQYKYYRNITICASPTDKDALGKNDLAEYTKANGVKFDVAIRNALSNETSEDAKQTITINTGTLHPDDLAKFICETPFTGKEGYNYYFTTGWMDTAKEDVPELGEYFEGLKRQGVVNECILWTDESGLTGTDAYDKPAKAAFGEGLAKYMLACGSVSAACNGLTSGGVTAIGALLYGPLLDCGIPAVTTYRSQIAQSSGWVKTLDNMLTSLGEMTKDMPIIGSMLRNMLLIKEDLDAPVARPGLVYQGAETIVDSLLTRLVTQGPTKMTSTWPISTQKSLIAKTVNYTSAIGSKGFTGEALETAKTPLMVREFADKTSKELATSYDTALRKMVSSTGAVTPQTDALIKKVIEDYTKAMKTSITEKMTASIDSTYATGNRVLSLKGNSITSISSKTLTKALKDSIAESPIEFSKVLLKADTGSEKTMLQKIFALDSPNMTVDDIIAKLDATGTAETKSIASYLRATNKVDLTKLAIAIKGMSGICTGAIVPARTVTTAMGVVQTIPASVTPMNAAQKLNCKTELKNLGLDDAKADQIANRLNSMTDPAEIAKLNSADEVAKTIDDVVGTSAKASDDAMAKVTEKLKTYADDSAKKTSAGIESKAKITAPGRFARFGLNLGIGIGCSVASDMAGRKALNYTVESKTKALKEESKKALNLNVTLQKNKTYALAIVKSNGEWNYSITEVKDTKEVDRAISEKKGEIISTKKLVTDKVLSNNTKLPEERQLSYWKISTSINVAKELLPQKNYPFETTEAEHHFEILMDANVRQLISDYTNPSSKYYISGARENEVISVMLYFWGGKAKNGVWAQIENERNTHVGLVKSYTEKLRTANQKYDSKPLTRLTREDLISAFGKDTLDNTKADKLLKMVTFWELVLNNSPQVSVPTPNSSGVKPTAEASVAVPVATPAKK